VTSVRLEFGPDIWVECPHAPSPSVNNKHQTNVRNRIGMKNSLTFIVLFTSATMGFAQGKLAFVNSGDQPVYFSSDKTMLRGDDAYKTVGGFALAGSSLYTGAGGTIASLAGSPSIIASLWAGTSASSMTRRTTTTFGNVDFGGLLNQVNVVFPDLAPGVPAFFQIQIHDSRFASAWEAWTADGWGKYYAGASPIFQATPLAYVYAPIYQPTSPVNSTMPVGSTFVPLDYVGFPGYHGLIQVWVAIPEPGTLGLAVLGATALIIARRRR
jgi:hypothetical protein